MGQNLGTSDNAKAPQADTAAPEVDSTKQSAGDGGKQQADGLAADAAVRRLLARLGIGDGNRAAATSRAMNVTDGAQAKGKPVDDSEVEALTPRELAAFEAKVAQAADPRMLNAIHSAGGMVQFMKAMAAGQTVAGVNEAIFEQMWNNSVDEAWLKDKFRAVDPSMHEWIPSNQIEAIVQKAKTSPEGGTWIDVQNELRSPTDTVLFDPAKVMIEAPDGKGILMQGHVGALYLNGVMQTKQEAAFHDELRAAYAGASNIAAAIDALKAVMEAWMWKGEKLTKPLHPGLSDSKGKPIDEAAMLSQRAAEQPKMEALFDQMKAKYGNKGPAKK